MGNALGVLFNNDILTVADGRHRSSVIHADKMPMIPFVAAQHHAQEITRELGSDSQDYEDYYILPENFAVFSLKKNRGLSYVTQIT